MQWLASLLLLSVEWVSCWVHGELIEQSSYRTILSDQSDYQNIKYRFCILLSYRTNFFCSQTFRILNIVSVCTECVYCTVYQYFEMSGWVHGRQIICRGRTKLFCRVCGTVCRFVPCNENPIYVFLFWELRRLSPNFHIHVWGGRFI